MIGVVRWQKHTRHCQNFVSCGSMATLNAPYVVKRFIGRGGYRLDHQLAGILTFIGRCASTTEAFASWNVEMTFMCTLFKAEATTLLAKQ